MDGNWLGSSLTCRIPKAVLLTFLHGTPDDSNVSVMSLSAMIASDHDLSMRLCYLICSNLHWHMICLQKQFQRSGTILNLAESD